MINVKNSPLEYFENFKKRNDVKRYQEDCNDFELRNAIRDDLILKQRGQCAYCERKITKDDSIIEHINPRDKSPELECEYSNLVLSCKSDDSCDNFKGSKKWEDKYIHPVLNNPEEYFYFSANGEILSDNENGMETINFLNLNSKKLIRLRKDIILNLQYMQDIESISQYFNEHENLIKQFG